MDERATPTQPGHDEVIEPVKGRLAADRRPAAAGGAPRGRSGMLAAGIALAVLLVVAAGVVFVLPTWVGERREAEAGAEAGTASTEAAPDAAAEPAEPTLSPEEAARLQAQAEGLLADLLSQQARLEALSAESWGGRDWVEYEDSARAGDDAFLAEAYQDAVPAYTRALEIGEGLLERSVSIVAAALDAGAAALEAGNAAVAEEQFSLVLGIEADNETARAGLQRAQRLPDVLQAVQRAQGLERDGRLDEAAQAYRDALDIDAQWSPASAGLARVSQRIETRRFENLMSQGYAALAGEAYDDAYEHFAAALKLRPGSEEAVNGRLQAEQGQRLDQIALIEARAAAFERRELWARAIEQYQAALATDETLVFAQRGLERARARADLDSKLSHLLSNPNLLFDDRVLADAQRLLADAAEIAEPGPRLDEQTEELSRLVELASTPITIRLESDQKTEVTVYRVGSLGTFAQTTLELRPGTYTAVGSRDGYRDVRETFTVLPGRALEPVRVACIEPI